MGFWRSFWDKIFHRREAETAEYEALSEEARSAAILEALAEERRPEHEAADIRALVYAAQASPDPEERDAARQKLRRLRTVGRGAKAVAKAVGRDEVRDLRTISWLGRNAPNILPTSNVEGWGLKGQERMHPNVRSAINKGRGLLRKAAADIHELRGKGWKDKIEGEKNEYEILKDKLDELLKKIGGEQSGLSRV